MKTSCHSRIDDQSIMAQQSAKHFSLPDATLWVAIAIPLFFIPAVYCQWYIDDPYFLPFIDMTFAEAHEKWFDLYGFERLQSPLLAFLQYPLGYGYANALRAAVHVLCTILFGRWMLMLGWTPAAAYLSTFVYLVLPCQTESTFMLNFQSPISQICLLAALILFAKGSLADGFRRSSAYITTLVLLMITTQGHASYLFSPLMLLPTALCPIAEKWKAVGRGRSTMIAVTMCALLPIAVTAGLLSLKRYELRGDPNLIMAPKVFLSSQYRLVTWLVRQFEDLPTIQNAPHWILQSIVIVALVLLVYQRVPAATTEAKPRAAHCLAWAYLTMLIGYVPYWLASGATETGRQHYVASMGFAPLVGGTIAHLLSRNRRATIIHLTVVIVSLITSLVTFAGSWRWADATHVVTRLYNDRKDLRAVEAFVRLYAECGELAWHSGMPRDVRGKQTYDRYNIYNWVVTGYGGFLDPNDRRDIELQLSDKLCDAYRLIWPHLTAEQQEALVSRTTEFASSQTTAICLSEPYDPEHGSPAKNYPGTLDRILFSTQRLFECFLRQRLAGNPGLP